MEGNLHPTPSIWLIQILENCLNLFDVINVFDVAPCFIWAILIWKVRECDGYITFYDIQWDTVATIRWQYLRLTSYLDCPVFFILSMLKIIRILFRVFCIVWIKNAASYQWCDIREVARRFYSSSYLLHYLSITLIWNYTDVAYNPVMHAHFSSMCMIKSIKFVKNN